MRIGALFALGLLALPAQAQHLVATGGVGGRFARVRCHDEVPGTAHPAAGFTAHLDADLLIDTGGLLTPHGVSRFAARDAPELVVELVTGLGYDALALGESDLGAPRERMLRLAARLREAGVPMIASNLQCTADHPLCAAVEDAADPIHVVSASRSVAVLAMLSPEVLRRVAPDRAEGLSLAPLAEAVPLAVARSREAGAALVVLVVDLDAPHALELARVLPETGRPDLLVLSGGAGELLFARPATVEPAIAAPPPGGAVSLTMGEGPLGLDVVARPLPTGAPHTAVERFAAAVGAPYCAAWGRDLLGGHLDRPIDAAALAELSAAIVREHASADVAVLNAGAIDGSFADPELAELTASELYVAIAYDEPLVVADVPGSWLREVMDHAAEHQLVTPGLTSAGEGLSALRIRGRAPVDRASYRVVTLRFLAEGGDEALPALPEGTTWRTLEHTEGEVVRYDSLRDVVLHGLEAPSERDPRDVRPSPDEMPEWIARANLDGTFSGAAVDDANAYGSALLSVGDSVALGAELDLRLDATAPDWTWQTRLNGRYRTQWAPSAEPGMAGAFTEAQDQIQLRSLASYRGWRTEEGAVYVPDVYVEGFLETELTRPALRDFHWLLVRPTAGLRFPLLPELEVKLQGGFEVQVLAPAARVEPGAGAILTLNRWAVMEGDGRTLAVEGLADFFCADLGSTNHWQLRSRLDLSLDLFGPLAMTIGAQLYLEDRSALGVSTAFSATAGLRIAGVGRVVGP